MTKKQPDSWEVAVAILGEKIDHLAEVIKVDYKDQIAEIKAEAKDQAALVQVIRENQIRFRGTMKIWGWLGGVATAVLTAGLVAAMFDLVGKMAGSA